MSESMVSKLFGYFEGNGCSLEIVSLGKENRQLVFP